MSFISPMLAKVMPDDFDPEPGTWAVEEKFDGHRIVIQVFGAKFVIAWSRYGRERVLNDTMYRALQKFPNGVYDGELIVPGGRSYGVTELTNTDDLVYMMFDVLELLDTPTICEETYDHRRTYLLEIFSREALVSPKVQLATSTNVDNADELRDIRDAIWARDGEGLIVKRRSSVYLPGKRTKDWLKVKQLRSAVCTVVGFEAGTSTKQNRGPYAKVRLRDDAGHEFTVKTLDNAELAKFEEQGKPFIVNDTLYMHPAIGRQLRIEYQEQTPDGSYRHPRWDRWEDE